jgi:membrane protein
MRATTRSGNKREVGTRAKVGTPARGISSAVARERNRLKRRAGRLWAKLPGPGRRFFAEAHKDDLFLLAAGLAFYALVSVAPLVILVMWVTSLVVGDERLRQLATALGRYAPNGIGIDKGLTRVAQLGTTAGAWAIVTALWPATAYGAGLRRAFDRLSPKREQLEGLRGRGLAFFVLFPVFVLGSLISAYAGSKALGNGTDGQTAGIVVALTTGFAGAAVAILLIYRIFPARRMAWPEIGTATLVAAAGIAVLSAGYVAFLSLGTNFEEHYLTSSLAGVVLLGVWLFLANVLLLVGYKAAQSTG